MNQPMLTKTKVSTKTKVIVAVVVLAGLAALGYGAGLLPTSKDSGSLTLSSVSVSDVTSSSGIILIIANRDGVETVEWGVDKNYGSKYTGSVAKQSFSDTVSGLRAGTTYHFRVSVTDLQGRTVTSADQTFTTGAVAIPL